jgi:mono/diheme cytochrome c family protein
MKPNFNWLQMIFVVVTLFSVSCSKETKKQGTAGHGEAHGTPKDWKFTLPPGNVGDGRKLFVEAECHKCHEVKGEIFPAVGKDKGDVGPELSQMAGMHPPEFFAESIINPNAVIDPEAKKLGYVGEDGKSKMPDYNDTFTVRQLADIAAYLSSLKGVGGKAHH